MNFHDTHLEINNVEINYLNSKTPQLNSAVINFNLELKQGEIGCLLGSSGCGKSTVLRAICGFEKVRQGNILLREQIVSSTTKHTPAHLRNIGMVFQDFALFPHLNVLQNIMFGLGNRPYKNKVIQANKWLELVSLLDKATAYPHELSGGQQQRVALARAMAPEPDLILLDEPFSSMDLALRGHLTRELCQILKFNHTTALMVTHDQTEAFTIADKVGVMNEGKLIQWDSPYNLYQRPADRFIAEFIGQTFFIKGKISAKEKVQTPLGELILNTNQPIEIGRTVDVLLRFNDLLYDYQSPIRAKIMARTFRGSDFLYELNLDSISTVKLYLTCNQILEIGAIIGIGLPEKYKVTFVG